VRHRGSVATYAQQALDGRPGAQFAVATRPSGAARTEEADMTEKELRINTPDGVMRVFVAHPAGDGPFPVAVLYMDEIGYRRQIKANGRRFAAAGYYCVAPDLFYRVGEGVTAEIEQLAAQGFEGPAAEIRSSLVANLKPELVRADTDAIFSKVDSDPVASPGPRVLVGYGMGARFALHMAAAWSDEFVAAAAIDARALIATEPDSSDYDLHRVPGELYVAFADNDPALTPDVVDRFRAKLERNGILGVVETLPGTSRGFATTDLPADRQGAAERHFERTLDLWRRSLAAAERQGVMDANAETQSCP
jgi:carboxymethylenebutenolidase